MAPASGIQHEWLHTKRHVLGETKEDAPAREQSDMASLICHASRGTYLDSADIARAYRQLQLDPADCMAPILFQV